MKLNEWKKPLCILKDAKEQEREEDISVFYAQAKEIVCWMNQFLSTEYRRVSILFFNFSITVVALLMNGNFYFF